MWSITTGIDRPFEFRPDCSRIFLPAKRRRFLFQRFRLRKRDSLGTRNGETLYHRIGQILGKEYHIDGFRFDLMGIHDIETMNRLRSELLEIDPTIFVYGEGWVADSPLPFEQRAVKENVGQMEGIGVFNDEFRDGLKGSTFDEQEPGYASGNINGHFEPVKYGIVGGTDHPQVDYGGLLYCNAPYAGAPSQMINFVSCHDGYTLVDKLKLSVQGDYAADELIPIDKLVHTVLLTAQGIPFIRSGEEIMQDKQGEPNSYKSPDSINRIDWSLKAKTGRYSTLSEG